MKTNYRFLILILISLSSCNNCVKTYYSNGKIKLVKCKISNSKYKITYYDSVGNLTSIKCLNTKGNYDSISVYYRNGVLDETVKFEDGKPYEYVTIYYSNGKIKETYTLKNRLIEGKRRFYNKEGKLGLVHIYKILNNTSLLISEIIFDENENAISDSSKFADIILKNDTIALNEFLDYKFVREMPACDASILFAEFDKNFNIIDSSTKRYLKDINNPFKIKATKKGNDTLRVVFKILDSKTKMFFPIYIEKPFFVY